MTENEVKALPTLILQLSGDKSKNKELYPNQGDDLPYTAAEIQLRKLGGAACKT